MIDTKVCSSCKVEKPKTEYHKRLDRPCGVKSICKECVLIYPKEKKRAEGYSRRYGLLRSYGITLEDFEKMLISQDYKCIICNIHSDSVMSHKTHRHLCVDHCHDTGMIRGLLCNNCNRAIGILKDDPQVLLNAYNYLIKYK